MRGEYKQNWKPIKDKEKENERGVEGGEKEKSKSLESKSRKIVDYKPSKKRELLTTTSFALLLSPPQFARVVNSQYSISVEKNEQVVEFQFFISESVSDTRVS